MALICPLGTHLAKVPAKKVKTVRLNEHTAFPSQSCSIVKVDETLAVRFRHPSKRNSVAFVCYHCIFRTKPYDSSLFPL